MFSGIAGEIKRRELKNNYAAFVEHVNEGCVLTHFHHYLCEQVQEFLAHKSGKALDILLLSVPPRDRKSVVQG